MAETGRDPDLAEKSLGTEHRAELGIEHLDGHLAMVPQVVGQVDGGHPASPELTVEGVAVGQPGPQRGLEFGQEGGQAAGRLQKAGGSEVGREKRLDLAPEGRIGTARSIQERGSLAGGLVARSEEYGFDLAPALGREPRRGLARGHTLTLGLGDT